MPPSPRPQPSLSLPKLYAIVDAEVCAAAGRTPGDVARAFLSAGARLIQLRCKSWGSGAFLDLARSGTTLAAGGLYRASHSGRQVVFRIAETAAPGATPLVGRLVRFQSPR